MIGTPPKTVYVWTLKFNANDVLLYCRLLEAPVDVRMVAKVLGVDIRELPKPGWSGAAKRVDVRRVLWVPEEDDEVRKRFTIAHLLGHFVQQPKKTLFVESNFQGRGENSANLFATELLMPKALVVASMSDIGPNRKLLAETFDVSEEAMKMRTETLWKSL